MSEETGSKEQEGGENATIAAAPFIAAPITAADPTIEAPITAAAPTIEAPIVAADPTIEAPIVAAPSSEQFSEAPSIIVNTDTVTTPDSAIAAVDGLHPDTAAVDTAVDVAAQTAIQPTSDTNVEPTGAEPMEATQTEPVVEQPTNEQNLEPVIEQAVTQLPASDLTATNDASLETDNNTLVETENNTNTEPMDVTAETNEQNNINDTDNTTEIKEQNNVINTDTNQSGEGEVEKNGGEKRNVSECVSEENEERANKKIKPSDNEENNTITADKSSVEATTNGVTTASAADACEVSSSIKLKEGLSLSIESLTNGSTSDNVSKDNVVETEEAKNNDNAQEKTSENSIERNDSETKSQNESTEKEEEMGDTASKLLASGISISLIKKKGGESGSGEGTGTGTASTEQQESTEQPSTNQESENVTSNPLEVGPNISVTMINKNTTPATITDTPATSSSPAVASASAASTSVTTASVTSATKFTLSLKSQSLLMDPKKSETSSNTPNIVSSGGSSSVADSISVSKISRPLAVNNQAALAKAIITSKQSSMAASQNSLSRSAGVTSNGMPGLQPRPFLTRANPSGSQHLANAGPVSEQLNLVAGGIADYMRHGIEEILRELSAQGSSEATIKGLQLEMERIKWRHQQELAEVKSNIDNMLKDMKAKITNESQRTIEEFKKQAEIERQKVILETKKKQWCAQCGKEAIFYCCWNTSYCDYPCQQSHWPSHMATCAQTTAEEEAQQQQDQKPAMAAAQQQVQQVQQQQQQHVQSPVASMMNSMHRQPGVVGGMGMNSLSMASDVTNGLTPSSMGGYMLGGMGGMNMRPTSQSMMRGNPMGMGNGMRPGVPGQLTISRPPYFM